MLSMREDPAYPSHLLKLAAPHFATKNFFQQTEVCKDIVKNGIVFE